MFLIVPGINPVRAAKVSGAATLPSTVIEVVPRTAVPPARVSAPDANGKPFSELPGEHQAAVLRRLSVR